MALLQEWNRSCQPPWSQAELDHKLREADTKEFGKPRGYLLNARGARPEWSSPGPAPTPAAAASGPKELPKLDYDLDQAAQLALPTPIADGFDKVLRSCFQPGEGVRVMFAINEDTGSIGCDPHGGVVLSREEWLEKISKYSAGINALFSRMGGPPPGVYLGVNPMKQDGRGRDTDVTNYRHCLLEFDNLSLEEQWLLYTQSNLPCAAVIYSGARSLHAWVKINAKDRAEYNERVNLVYNHFATYKPDPHNKNPSRFSRCPDAKRGDAFQLLLALDIGSPSFTEWSKHLLVQGIGSTYTENEILNYNPDEDGMTVVGHHWLRKGGSALVVGPCLHGCTPIFDPVDGSSHSVEERFDRGLPFHVFSLARDGSVVIADAHPPQQFDPMPMIQLTLSNGRILTVTPAHRILTSRGYQSVYDVLWQLQQGVGVHLPSISEHDLSALLPDARRCKGTARDFPDDYRACPHCDDARLPWEEGCAPTALPSPGDAHVHNHSCCSKDDLAAKPGYTRPHPADVLQSTPGFYHQEAPCREWGYRNFSMPEPLDCDLFSLSPPLFSGCCQTDTNSPLLVVVGPSTVDVSGCQSQLRCQVFCASSIPTLSNSHNAGQFLWGPSPDGSLLPLQPSDLFVGSYEPSIKNHIGIVKAQWLPRWSKYYDFHVPGHLN
jgi:hypothetical protein